MKKKLSFKELINGSKPTLVDFSATWCGPCQAMGPILKEVVHTVGDAATVVKVDVDKNQALAQQLNVQGVPTFILYQNGKIKWRQSGMQSAHALVHILRSAINNKL